MERTDQQKNSERNIFQRIWSPTEEDMEKAKIFQISLSCGIGFFIILSLLIKSSLWPYILLVLFVSIIVLRIIMGIRIQIIRSASIKTKSDKLFGSLPEDKRNKFIKRAFVKMPIGYIIGISVGYGLLYIFSQAEEKPLSFMLIFFACLFPLLIIIYSLWNYYNDLSQDKEDKFS